MEAIKVHRENLDRLTPPNVVPLLEGPRSTSTPNLCDWVMDQAINPLVLMTWVMDIDGQWTTYKSQGRQLLSHEASAACRKSSSYATPSSTTPCLKTLQLFKSKADHKYPPRSHEILSNVINVKATAYSFGTWCGCVESWSKWYIQYPATCVPAPRLHEQHRSLMHPSDFRPRNWQFFGGNSCLSRIPFDSLGYPVTDSNPGRTVWTVSLLRIFNWTDTVLSGLGQTAEIAPAAVARRSRCWPPKLLMEEMNRNV